MTFDWKPKALFFCLAGSCFFGGAGSQAAEFPEVHAYPTQGWHLVRVSSGDTLVIAHETDDIERSVRLRGVVAPRRSFPGAAEVRTELKRVLSGRKLGVAFFEMDRFGQPYVTIRTEMLPDVSQHLLARRLVEVRDHDDYGVGRIPPSGTEQKAAGSTIAQNVEEIAWMAEESRSAIQENTEAAQDRETAGRFRMNSSKK